MWVLELYYGTMILIILEAPRVCQTCVGQSHVWKATGRGFDLACAAGSSGSYVKSDPWPSKGMPGHQEYVK